jgi:hypothetical protein
MKTPSNLFSQLPVCNCEVLDSTAAAGLVASLIVPFAPNILTAEYSPMVERASHYERETRHPASGFQEEVGRIRDCEVCSSTVV